jgi:hypothetical protein
VRVYYTVGGTVRPIRGDLNGLMTTFLIMHDPFQSWYQPQSLGRMLFDVPLDKVGEVLA